MAKSYEEVKGVISVIKNEVEDGRNTAQRVGGAMDDIVDYTKESLEAQEERINEETDIKISGLVVQETGDGEKVVMSQKSVTEKFTELGQEMNKKPPFGKQAIIIDGNLLNDVSFTEDKILNANGQEASYLAYGYTDYIDISSYAALKISLIPQHGGCWYDKDKNYIGGFGSEESKYNAVLNIPSNAVYIRANFSYNARKEKTAYLIDYYNQDIVVGFPWLWDERFEYIDEKIKFGKPQFNLPKGLQIPQIQFDFWNVVEYEDGILNNNGGLSDYEFRTVKYDISRYVGENLTLFLVGTAQNYERIFPLFVIENSNGEKSCHYSSNMDVNYGAVVDNYIVLEGDKYLYASVAYTATIIGACALLTSVDFNKDHQQLNNIAPMLKPSTSEVLQVVEKESVIDVLNLYNENSEDVVEGEFISGIDKTTSPYTLVWSEFTGIKESGYIEVSEGEKLYKTDFDSEGGVTRTDWGHLAVCLFDEDKNPIRMITNPSIVGFVEIPSKVKYIRFCYTSDKVVISKNGNVEKYIEYSPYIKIKDRLLLLEESTKKDIKKIEDKLSSIEGYKSHWIGKKIVWLGTSIPWGQTDENNPGTTTRADNPYPKQVCEALGATLIDSTHGGLAQEAAYSEEKGMWFPKPYSVGGMSSGGSCSLTIEECVNAYNEGLTGANHSARSYENYVLGKDADLYIFDVEPNNANGDLTDLENFNWYTWSYNDGSDFASHRNTYVGALIYIIDKLLTEKPNAVIVFVGEYGYMKSSNYDEEYKISTASKKICDKFHIHYIDLWSKLGYNGKNKSVWLNDDMVHPKQALYDRIAKMMIGELMLLA